MPPAINRWLHRLGLYHPLRDLRRDWRFRQANRAAVRAWHREGCPSPPPDGIKYDCIRNYALRHRTPILIETGTFFGHALFTLRRCFRELHSIELAPELHARNQRELGHLPHIHLHLGDSTAILPRLLAGLKAPALFWLDGHWCAGPSARGAVDTPIRAELAAILARPAGRDVVLVDDARCFTGQGGYPTVDELRELFARHRPGAMFEVSNDIIRIVPV